MRSFRPALAYEQAIVSALDEGEREQLERLIDKLSAASQ